MLKYLFRYNIEYIWVNFEKVMYNSRLQWNVNYSFGRAEYILSEV